MSKFNTRVSENKTVNYAGGESFTENSKLELVSLMSTSFVKDKFYESENETLERLRKLIDLTDKKFVAKAALYVRNELGMRSITHVVAGEIASKVKGETWTKNFFDKIIHRPDDLTEILAYYYSLGNKNEPHSMRKGFASALSRFDEYKLAKYRAEGERVSLVDVVNLVHPANTDAISKLIKGELKSFDTWEVEISKAGSDSELKADAWYKLVSEKKIGYMALLKNMRNLLEKSPQSVELAVSMLTDKELIKKSMVLPFRFSTALDEISKVSGVDTQLVRKVIRAINEAIDISMSNVPIFDGNTLVVLDESGSMGDIEDNKSPFSIGSLFSAVLVKVNNADFMGFSDTASYRNINPMDSTLSIRKYMEQTRDTGGTNFHAIFQEINKKYDRIIILSDMQGWMGYNAPTGELQDYRTRYGCSPKIYSFDLNGYGTLQFPERDVYCLAGFSEKVLDIVKYIETDKNALINKIESIEL